jgi:mono/diheme cytochrome c family protein
MLATEPGGFIGLSRPDALAGSMLNRLLAVCALAVVFVGSLLVSTHQAYADDLVAAIPNFDRDVLPFFQNHCIRCHGPADQSGDFRMDTLSRDVGGAAAKRWRDVMERISAGEMPPEDEPKRPSAEEAQQVLEWLSARIKEGESARLAKRDRVSFHRLSREEYAHTVYDLLGVHYDVADPGAFDPDPEWQGFERIGSVMSLSASHVDKYMAAAEAILAEAFPVKEPTPFVVRKSALDLRGGPTQQEIEKLKATGLADKVRVDLWPGHDLQGGRPGPGRSFEVSGVYRVRVQLSGLKPPGGRAPHLAFYADRVDRMLFEQDIIAPEDKPTVVEFEAHLPAGGHSFQLTNAVPGPSNLPRSGRSGRKPFFSIADGRIPWQLKLTDEDGQPLYPFLIVDWVEWEGPIISSEERERRDGYLPPEKGNIDQVRASLTRFAQRAFRRPLVEGEIDKYVHLVESEIAAGAEFFAAVKTGMLAILSSKDFYYIVEGSPDALRAALNDWELASRLSYFLWSTMPDEELFQLARDGRLHEPDVLRQQVGRMLADPKAERFAESFSHQWLQLGRVGMFPPDSKLYPDYEPYLEQSMIGETQAFFRHVLDENLSLREFLHSDWTMVNPRLAMHYGMTIPEGDAFHHVKLTPEDHRGGMLTHASVLSLSSDGTRHRPVHRGVWLSEVIFGLTPPPPPANVDPIEPNPVDAPKATIRMKLDAHKHDANCASCHRKIDPLGLAFDHYDAIGRWRTVERVAAGVGADPAVDASGELPDGRSFRDHVEFQQLMLDDVDRFGHAFVEKLATYALRRTMTVDDREDLDAVAALAREHDYRLRDIVETLILSDLFQKR